MSDNVLSEDQKFIAAWVKEQTGIELIAEMAVTDAFRAIADAVRVVQKVNQK